MKSFIKSVAISICICAAFAHRAQAGPYDEPTATDVNGVTIQARGGAFFLIAGPKRYLQQQIDACKDVGLASGDANEQKRCEGRAQMAYQYLKAQAYQSNLPMFVWQMCGGLWADDMPMGARCIAAAKDICKVGADGRLQDEPSCSRIMEGSLWTTNPSARALNFDR